jgi:ubiquitin-protein ligase
MAESPRIRRLRADRRALEQLKAESSVFDFVARGEIPDTYTLLFRGTGVWRADQFSPVQTTERHEVYLRLGAAYPRMMPELTWRSPIFHPNISASGVVCLGGYGTYWVPSLSLDELCTMLWDMIRYANYDPNSPYNRDAAIWAKGQTDFHFPLDSRPIRDRVARKSRPAAPPVRTPKVSPVVTPTMPAASSATLVTPPQASEGITFLQSDVIDAQVVNPQADDAGILFID